MEWIWKAVVIVIAGTTLLRIAGRKSISQMTLPQTVLMIGIGSLLIQPLADKNIWMTIAVGAALVLTLVIIEFAQIKGNWLEKLLIGKSKVVIKDGVLQEKELKKVRMTVDQLETNLRQNNIARTKDVAWATLEPNGQIGYMLKPEAQPVTKKEFQAFASSIESSLARISAIPDTSELQKQLQELQTQLNEAKSGHLFIEVDRKSHINPPPEHLQ
ncbi:UPF0702 transmembrane protein YdfR [Lentibacillus sp. JNUCC-1]|uniref:DUF421 domain-containing protein n=1 Tax=Lentibacillus sp. JNUCC-1 TaxID=2654513 RepID=UPI0012E94CA3|nr:DUF421 domain-containing protein [Lentibacillus sp. JNUCC-1]MUV37554.1 UPF0702 transmembrane protein YdfR [Lentibacillus sp. JNUCC-1]